MSNPEGDGVRVCLLASGSKGNSILVESGETRLLIDAGLAAAEIIRRLDAVGVDAASLNAILVTHEHTDHVRGVGTLARRLKIPVITSYPTSREIAPLLKKIEVIEFETGHSFAFRDLLIDPFPLTHDAVDPVGFVIEEGRGIFGSATDLGVATRLVAEKLRRCRVLVLEFNHDEEMLLNGPYPWHLKQRIKSRHGHLSNYDSRDLLDDILHDGLEGLFLAHLSEVNNHPDVAHREALSVLDGVTCCAPRVEIGNQYQPTRIIEP
jgi:phosphoribosyl 1,2-cyclic phosphodiesterase